MKPTDHNVVITGASSGIGRATVLLLDRLGHRVFAGVRPRAHLEVGPGSRKMKNLARLPVGLRDWLLAKAVYSRRTA